MDWLAVTSTAFRAFAYLFLRIIPFTWAKWILPPLLFIYLTLYATSKPQTANETESDGNLPKTTPRSPEDPWRVVVLSASSASPRLNRANLLINLLLFGFSIDLLVHPLLDPAHDVVFTRIGSVSPESIKVTVRYPESNATEHTIKLLWRESPPKSDHWRDGPFLKLSQENDWVASAKISGLWPKTSYEYTLAYPNRTILPYPPRPIQFRTFPDPRLPGSHFRFLVSSCILPNFPYVPGHHRTITGFDHVAQYLETQTPTPITEFMLFLGDFIYSDVPLYAGDNVESYTRLYRRNYASPSFRNVYERLPMFHTYDDHEILNNFAGEGNDSTSPFASASKPFQLYNADANPDPVKKDTFYYSFSRGDVAFFVLDTRRYRNDVTKASEEPVTMLGEEQITALHNWLVKVNSTATFKFVVSSVPFTNLWGWEANQDSWRAYPSEKATLLSLFHTVPNLVILSGDRHEFAHVQINPSLPWQHPVTEISTSPLNMFYVPLIRTMASKSQEKVQIQKEVTEDGEMTTEVTEIPKEEAIKYIWKGNSKFSAIEIDTRDLQKPTLRLELLVDGAPAYNYEVVGIPVELRSGASALGAFVASNIKEAFDKFGFQPTKWF